MSNNKIKITIKPKIHQPQLNVIDLFCGCGGMSQGLCDAGLNIIAGVDICQTAIDTY